MIERSPGTKTRRLLLHERSDSPDNKSNKQSIRSVSNDISQLNAATTMECGSFEIAKPNFINLLALCKYATYRNNDRCLRIFLLATKFLSDTNAMKMFNVFYNNKMFLQLSDFYICWAQRCGQQNHSIVRSILIKAEKMDAKPKCAIDIRKRQFAIKEEELILNNNDNKAISGIAETIRPSIYPWNIQLQAELMDDMKVPNFIKFYNRKMPPFNFIFHKLSFPKQTSNDSLNYICSIKSIPDRYFILKIRPKHQNYWEAYIYHYVEDELRLISGIIQIYHCLTFIDKCLTVQEFRAGTLKELIEIQKFDSKKLNELIIAIIILDLMKILRCIHQMNIIHGCFRSDNIFIAKRLISKPQLGTLNNDKTLIVKLANWDFAIRDIDGTKYDGQYINENKVITNDDYECEPWNYEIDRLGFVNIVNELICNQTMCYLRCKNRRYIPLLNLKRNWSMHDHWSNLIHKCLNNTVLHTWDELINDLAEATDNFIRINGDQWIKFIAEYNLLFLKLLKRNSQFYP